MILSKNFTSNYLTTSLGHSLQLLLSVIMLGLVTVSIAFFIVKLISKSLKQPHGLALQKVASNNAGLISVLMLGVVLLLNLTGRLLPENMHAFVNDSQLFFSLLTLFFAIYGLLRHSMSHHNVWWQGNKEVRYALRIFRYWTLSLVGMYLFFIFMYKQQNMTWHREFLLFNKHMMLISGSWLFAVVVYWLTRLLRRYDNVLEQTVKSLTIHTIRGLITPLRIIALMALINSIRFLGEFPPPIMVLLTRIDRIMLVCAVALFCLKLVDGWHIILIDKNKTSSNALDLTSIQIMVLGLRAVIYLVAFLTIMQVLSEQKLTAILAGLGIGGAALALASQDLLKNIFGGFTIMMDKPFNLNQRIRIQAEDLEGVVERIGFRSTRLRTLGGNLVTIPNTIISNNSVENVAMREAIRRDIILNFPLSTTTEKMTQLIEQLRELLNEQGEAFDYENRPPRIYFGDFKEWSLVVTITYWYNSTDWWNSVLFGEKINVSIMHLIDALELRLALPKQSITLEQDEMR
jgi:MscS family membrane protein